MIFEHSKDEITIKNDDGIILCKFYQCIEGYLVEYDEEKVTKFIPDYSIKVDAQLGE